MATIPNQIRIDTDIKKQADNIFNNSTFPHEKHIKNIEIWVYFKNIILYLT